MNIELEKFELPESKEDLNDHAVFVVEKPRFYVDPEVVSDLIDMLAN